jgi:hypothetical protein
VIYNDTPLPSALGSLGTIAQQARGWTDPARAMRDALGHALRELEGNATATALRNVLGVSAAGVGVVPAFPAFAHLFDTPGETLAAAIRNQTREAQERWPARVESAIGVLAAPVSPPLPDVVFAPSGPFTEPMPCDCDLQIEALEAENESLRAQVEALESRVRELRMLRRSQVLDASQEHRPEPPVDESPFPDPR